MTELDMKIKKLFKMCESVNVQTDRAVIFTELHNIECQSSIVFNEMSSGVNSFGANSMTEITSREYLVKMLYIVLKSVYLYGKYTDMFYNRFNEGRSEGTYKLACRLMDELKYLDKKMGSKNWMLNDLIYTKGLMISLGKIHPTLLQSMVRCMLKSLDIEEIKNQKLFKYLESFEFDVIYFTHCGGNRQIYLPLI